MAALWGPEPALRCCSKNFMWIHLFNPFIRSLNWYHYLSHVRHDTNEAQRGWVTWAELQSSWVQGLDSSHRSWSPESVYQYRLSAEWEWENARIKPKSPAIIAERRVPGIQDQALPMSAKRAFFPGQWEEGARRRGVGEGGLCSFPASTVIQLISVSAPSQWPPDSKLQPVSAPGISKLPMFSLHILRYYVTHFFLYCFPVFPVFFMSSDRISSKMTGIFRSALFMHVNWDLNIIAPQNYLLNELLGPRPPPPSLVIARDGHRALELEVIRGHL